MKEKSNACLRSVAFTLALACLYPTVIIAARDVTVNDTQVYPESLTALSDGTVILGSIGKPIIYRAGPDKTIAEPWIHLSGEGSVSTLGVLADPKTKTLWVCEVEQDPGTPLPPRHSVLRTFDLKSGNPKASYPLLGASNLCNDIAVAADGTVYVSDTTNGQILRLKARGALRVWLKDSTLEGIDGLTFVKSMLYVNSITQSTILRIPIKPNGAPGSPVQMNLSQPIVLPDGMRSEAGRLFVAEHGAGRVSELKLDGDKVTVVVIKDGYISPTGVQPVGTMLWISESKLAYMRDPKLQGQDPGAFKAYSVPLK